MAECDFGIGTAAALEIRDLEILEMISERRFEEIWEVRSEESWEDLRSRSDWVIKMDTQKNSSNNTRLNLGCQVTLRCKLQVCDFWLKKNSSNNTRLNLGCLGWAWAKSHCDASCKSVIFDLKKTHQSNNYTRLNLGCQCQVTLRCKLQVCDFCLLKQSYPCWPQWLATCNCHPPAELWSGSWIQSAQYVVIGDGDWLVSWTWLL